MYNLNLFNRHINFLELDACNQFHWGYGRGNIFKCKCNHKCVGYSEKIILEIFPYPLTIF